MKNFVRWFGIVAFVAVIGFSMAGCDLFGNDYELLNGVWDRGDIVVTFNDDSAVFTQINSNSGWKTVQNNGSIRIGDRKFRNIKKTNDLEWSCQELTYDLNTYRLSDWEDCTITISGQTLQTVSIDTNTYTRKE